MYLCALVKRIAQFRFSGYRNDIGKFLGGKARDRNFCAVSDLHAYISQYSRVSSRNDRVNGINLIHYRVVVRLDGNDRRVVYSTRLDEYRLCLVGFLILHGERTRTERHLHVKVSFCFILQAQFLIQFLDSNHGEQVLGLEHFAFEEDVIGACVAVLCGHDDLAGLTDRT